MLNSVITLSYGCFFFNFYFVHVSIYLNKKLFNRTKICEPALGYLATFLFIKYFLFNLNICVDKTVFGVLEGKEIYYYPRENQALIRQNTKCQA